MKKIVIEIDNLTEAQEIAIEHFMRMWQSLGAIGASRYTSFFADGDGNFRPKITVNGKKPKWFKNPKKERTEKYPMDYHLKHLSIDFDEIAWLLHDYKKEDLQED